jgi:glutathione synthase/RimK-type ligase-like ATP-grasp enzyme
VTSRRIAVATWSNPEYVDPEAVEVARALVDRGHDGRAEHWDGEVDWGACDLVVVRSTWDYFGRLEEFLEWVDHVDTVSRIVNPPNVIRWNSHKGYLAELGRAGIPVVEGLALPRGTVDAAAQVVSRGWEEVVVKPAVDGGARRATKGGAGSATVTAHLEDLLATDDVIVQPYLASVEQGETSLFFFGGELSHAVRKVPRPGDYRVQALHGGSEEPHDPTVREVEVARAAMAQVPGELVYARADFLDVDDEPVLMELELIEPDLFLRMAEGSLDRYVGALLDALG